MFYPSSNVEVLAFDPLSDDDEGGIECMLVEEEQDQHRERETEGKAQGDTNSRKKKSMWKKIRIKMRRLRKKKAKSSEQEAGELAVSTKSTFSESSSSSVDSTYSSSNSSSVLETEEAPLLIESRIWNSGALDDDLSSYNAFTFVPDTVSKEVLADLDLSNRTSALHNSEIITMKENDPVTHVKTGIWQVTPFIAEKEEEDNNTTTRSSQEEKPFYVVTAVSMDDRVDMKKLRKAINSTRTFVRRPKISMAPKEIAEALTGYTSGTMAPICHSIHSMLFAEESIFGHEDEQNYSVDRVCVGSGIFGTCLSISKENFLKIAKTNPEGMKICSLIQRRKGTNVPQ
jgi:prolyl-tRNA editing enzyme YbaK/EbsC (Cys-tRNA(Pro) deacylase)